MIQRGGFSAVSANAQPGFDFHNASITAGIDYRFTADFVAGIALGYNRNHSSLDQDSGKVDVDGYSVNGYFTWYRNDFYLEGSAILGWLDYDLRRNINYQIDSLASSGGLTTINQTAKASPGGDQNSLALSFGRDFNYQAWTFGPYVRGIYSHLNLDGFSETMSDPGAQGGGLGTSVERRSATSELAVLGGRVSYATSFDWGVLVPNALLEWNHEFNNDAHNVVSRFLADPTQTPIVLTDTPPDTNYFNIGIGLNAVLPKGRSGFVYLEHLAGYSGAHENRLSIGIRIEF
jgi:outer membrane autotransporter protein